MPRYLISFEAGAMAIADEDLTAVTEAALGVVRKPAAVPKRSESSCSTRQPDTERSTGG